MVSPHILNPIAATAATVYGTAGTVDLVANLQTPFFSKIMANHIFGFSSLPLTGPAAGVLALAVVNSGHKNQSSLSKAFSTAAAFTGIVALAGALTPISDSLLPVAVCYGATALSGAASLTSYLTRNTHLKVQSGTSPKP